MNLIRFHYHELETVCTVMPFESMASTSNTTRDYFDIEELNTKYYATVFISDEMEITLTENNPPPFRSTYDINELNSTVVVENFDSTSTYKMFYSGYSCGIAYTFASPYPFNMSNPKKRR